MEPAKETKPPVDEPMESAAETKQPVEETMEPGAETKQPVEETMEPGAETKQPVEETMVETKQPVEETMEPEEETEESMYASMEVKEPEKKEEEEEKIVPIPPKPAPVKFERREEVFLRKRKDQREKKLAWLEKRQKRKDRKTANRAKIKLKTYNFRTPDRDIIRYLRMEAQLRRAKRRVKTTKEFGHWRFRLPMTVPKLLIVIRIKGVRDVNPEFVKIFKEMHLNFIYQARFMRKTPELLDKLLRIGPYVTFGAPSQEAIRDLLHRRGKLLGFDEDEKKRVKIPISDNRMIEDKLGEYDIICVEDLVEEIVNVGPAFQKCMDNLATFSVTPPKGRRWNYIKQFRDGGDWGYRPGNKIMELFL